MNTLNKTTESGYLLVIGYIRQFCSIFKLSNRITFPVQLMIVMYYPPNYHIFGLKADVDFGSVDTRRRFKKMEVFSLLCDDRNEIRCNYDRYVIKTTLKEIYYSWNYNASTSSSGFFKVPQNKNNLQGDYVDIISDGKFGEHTIMVSKNNKFYAFGPNDSGQYGCGHRSPNCRQTNEDTKKGQLYALKSLRRVFTAIKLKQIKCGSGHTLFLTNSGRVYGCGQNKTGQIGILNEYKCYQLEPTLIPFLYDIIEMDCGRKHNLCLDARGNVWCFGFNGNGQLGLPYVDPSGSADHPYVEVPVVNQWFKFRNMKIKQVRCGYDFSLCMDQRGRVYLFGCNETGQIGNGKEYEYRVPIPFLLFSKQIRSASLGYNHCVFVDVDNDIWTCGANNNSQCSIKMDRDVNIVRPYHLEKK
eukprot:66048_1